MAKSLLALAAAAVLVLGGACDAPPRKPPQQNASIEENKAYYAESMAIKPAEEAKKKARAEAKPELDRLAIHLNEIKDDFRMVSSRNVPQAYELALALDALEVHGNDEPLLRLRSEMKPLLRPGTENQLLDDAIYYGRKYYDLSQSIKK